MKPLVRGVAHDRKGHTVRLDERVPTRCSALPRPREGGPPGGSDDGGQGRQREQRPGDQRRTRAPRHGVGVVTPDPARRRCSRVTLGGTGFRFALLLATLAVAAAAPAAVAGGSATRASLTP